MAKSPDAFRTISEVADWLGVQAHVLRFWESKFSQVKPVKRAGGRRYYRPNDMLLLGGIRRLLHEDGLTIKGVQKLLREEGISHVASLSQPLDDLTQFELDDGNADEDIIDHVAEVEEETAVVLNFETPPAGDAATAEPDPAEEAQPEPETTHLEEPPAGAKEGEEEIAAAPAPPSEPEPIEDPMPEEASAEEPAPGEEPAEMQPSEAAEETEAAAEVAQTHSAEPAQEEPDDAPESNDAALPAFLRRPMAEPPETDNPPVEDAVEAAPEPPAPKPRIIDMPPVTPLDQIDAGPGVLTAAMHAGSLTQDQARQIAPLLARLTVLRDSMAARRRPGPSD